MIARGRGIRALLALALLAAPLACAGPPWFLGSPLDGKPSITPGSAKLTLAEQRAAGKRERNGGYRVLEIEALLAIEDAARLTRHERARLAVLLVARAADFHARGRAVAEDRDLRMLERLTEKAPPPDLRPRRADAARAAGDAWLSIGALGEAAEAYRQAEALGAADMDFRLVAADALPPPADLSPATVEAAVAVLPLRAVPLFAQAYLDAGGHDPELLSRALAAARQERAAGLAARIEALLPPAAPASGIEVPGPAPPAAVAALPPDLDHWLLSGPTLSARLVPLVADHPEILDDRARARRWVDLLLAEDPTSPDVLEVAALAFGRAGRFGGTERMLMELAYHTPDRAAGLARGAALWERVGRGRDACAQWIRAARWRDDPEDPIWRNAVSCTRRDPGAGDWRAIRQYVLDRARPERRDAIAASLDAAAAPVAAAPPGPK